MKIAVSAIGKNLDAAVDPRMGRCAYFILADTDSADFQVLENPGTAAGQGAGIAAVKMLLNTGAEAVIAGNFGPNAFQALAACGIVPYLCGSGTVRQAIEAFCAGELESAAGSTVQAHFGMAPGSPPAGIRGAGMGRGRGMGAGGGMGGGLR